MPIPEIDPVEMDVFYDCLEEFEVAPAVAESATVASVSTVGVDLAAAEAAGAAAGTAAEASGAASLSIAAGLATIGVALIAEAILAGIIAIVTEMAKAESVVIVIENRTRFPIKVLDTHVHHGKQTASI